MSQPIDPEKMRYLESSARDIGYLIGNAINRMNPGEPAGKYGFALILFSYEGSELTYISSADRSDMLKLLQEMISKLRDSEPGISADRN